MKTINEFFRTNIPDIYEKVNDGWGQEFPLCGIETESAVLFADIYGFSKKTHLIEDPVVTSLYVNNFLAWIYGEGLYREGALLDNYIGDEIMLVFPRALCPNPLEAAIKTAHRIVDNDHLQFYPRIGVASGSVFIGFISPSCKEEDRELLRISTFGNTVNLAARALQSSRDICFGDPISDEIKEYLKMIEQTGKNPHNPQITVVTDDLLEVERIVKGLGKKVRENSWSIELFNSPLLKREFKNMGFYNVVDLFNAGFCAPPVRIDTKAVFGDSDSMTDSDIEFLDTIAELKTVADSARGKGAIKQL